MSIGNAARARAPLPPVLASDVALDVARVVTRPSTCGDDAAAGDRCR